MATTPANQTNQTGAVSANDRPDGNPPAIDDPQLQSAMEHPRLIEEHHVVGPWGQDEIEATDERGRRWYQLRPEPRRRADLIGFNYTWWLVIWLFFIFFILLPWGGAWRY
jgi:hypothetical protein